MSNVQAFDINKPEDLSVLVNSGIIWKGGPKTIDFVIDALVEGRVSPTPGGLALIPAEVLTEVNRMRAALGEEDLQGTEVEVGG